MKKHIAELIVRIIVLLVFIVCIVIMFIHVGKLNVKQDQLEKLWQQYISAPPEDTVTNQRVGVSLAQARLYASRAYTMNMILALVASLVTLVYIVLLVRKINRYFGR